MKAKPTFRDESNNPEVCESTLKVKGERIMCECGCNVFTKLKNPTIDGWEIYRCNACNGIFETK